MNRVKARIKEKTMTMMDLVPYGRDFYLTMVKHLGGDITYRGVFDSFSQAHRAVAKGRADNYDIINANKQDNDGDSILTNYFIQGKKKIDNWFQDTDYPLLFWLSQCMGAQSKVLELGGMAGHFFYTIQNMVPVSERVTWTIAELPEAVSLGRQIAEERMEKRLFFSDSKEMALIDPADIFVTAGTLQYISEHLVDILKSLQAPPRHVIVHNLPVHQHRAFFTLQNLGICEVPYQIYAEPELIGQMNELGYRLKARWLKPRKIEIPFKRSLAIEGYMGFYFSKEH